MPTSSDLVTDLPADFEVFGQAVDTSLADLKGGTTGQVLKKNSNTDMDFVWSADSAGMTNPMTTTGDTIYSSSGSTPARLGIGSTGQVLTVSGGVPTWANAPAANPSFSLLSTTTLTGASTFTITGLSGYNTIYAIVQQASSSSASQTLQARVNGSSSGIYSSYGLRVAANNPYDSNVTSAYSSALDTSLPLATMSDGDTSAISGYVRIEGANSSGIKMFQSTFGATPGSSYYQQIRTLGGIIETTSVISSFTLFFGANFDNGTLRIFGSVA